MHGDGYGALGADGYDLGAPAGGAGSSTRDGEATPVDGAERGAASGTPEPKTYWGECGWDGYAWGGVTRTHFRFADSHSTGAYKHAGKRDSFRLDYDAPRGGAVPRAEFGGAVCVEDAVGGGADGGVALREHADDPCRAGHDHQPECRTDAGAELWRTDGTKAGTTRVDDLRGGALGAQPKYLTPFAGALYFQARRHALFLSFFFLCRARPVGRIIFTTMGGQRQTKRAIDRGVYIGASAHNERPV